MLHQVRDSGLSGMQELEEKIQAMVSTLTSQENQIEKLLTEIEQHKETAYFSEVTTTKLSDDNSILREELDFVRGDLHEAKKGLNTLENEKRLRSKSKEILSKSSQENSGTEAVVKELEEKIEVLHEENVRLNELLNQLRAVNITDKDTEEEEEKEDETTSPVGNSTADISKDENETHKDMDNATDNTHQSTTDKDNLLLAKEMELQNTIEERKKLQDEFESLQNKLKKAQEDNTLLKCQLSQRSPVVAHSNTKQADVEINVTDTSKQNKKSSNSKITTSSSKKPKSSSTKKNLKIKMETSSKESIFIPCLNEDEDEDRNRNTVRNESGNESGDLDEFEIVTRESHPKNEAVVKRLDEHEIKEENGTKSDEILKHVGVTEFIPEQSFPPGKTDTEGATLELVVDLLQQLNEDNVHSYAQRDSDALTHVHTELNRTMKMVESFVRMSANLVNNEVDVVIGATEQLMGNLTEREKFDVRRKSLENPNTMESKHLQERVMKFGEEAIKVLMAGEQVVNTHVHTQHNKLSHVVSVMAEHKRRQSKAFKFPVPSDTEVHGLSIAAHSLSSKQSNVHLMPTGGDKQTQFTRFANAAERKKAILLMSQDHHQDDNEKLPLMVSGVHQDDHAHSLLDPFVGITGKGTGKGTGDVGQLHHTSRNNQTRYSRYENRDKTALQTTSKHSQKRRAHLFKPFHHGVQSRFGSLGTQPCFVGGQTRGVVGTGEVQGCGRRRLSKFQTLHSGQQVGNEKNSGATFLDLLGHSSMAHGRGRSECYRDESTVTKLPPINPYY